MGYVLLLYQRREKVQRPIKIKTRYKIGQFVTSIDPPDIDLYNTQKFNPLVEFLNKYKIGGLIINCRDIYVS